MDNFCPLCMDEEPEVISILQCGHKICLRCVSGFLFLYDFPKKCPMCREVTHMILIARSSEANQENFLSKNFGVEMKEAHLTPLNPTLKKIIALPDPWIFQSEAAVVIRKCDIKILLKEIIEMYSKCPLCDYQNLSFDCLKKHLLNKHKMLTCDLCPSPSEIFPKYFTFYNKKSLEEHKDIEHLLPNDYFNIRLNEVMEKNMEIVLFD